MISDETIARMAADRIAWTQVARAVLAGEYVHADSSTVASLLIGLDGMPDIVQCREAARMLRSGPRKSRSEPPK